MMMRKSVLAGALALVSVLPMAACARTDGGEGKAAAATQRKTIALTIKSANGSHAFQVETAKTDAEQERGLMYRTDLTDTGGMLFWPYPPSGGAPREASFWMKNTPSPLDIIFIRKDGTIARIVNAVPFDETPLSSGEPVGAVLELKGGRAAALGIGEGDLVTWAGSK